MSEEFISVAGQDGEIYEIRPTDALLHFLQRMAEDEAQEQETRPSAYALAQQTDTYLSCSHF